jgi:hypothetical protein
MFYMDYFASVSRSSQAAVDIRQLLRIMAAEAAIV